ncbi:MAG: hypothetical protein LBK95_08275 [Bifidobacteriaceae bacterium]|nr:hypothetical protein [Bifidobacteriaceae bacterium]
MSKQRIRRCLAAVVAAGLILIGMAAPPSEPAVAAGGHHRPGLDGATKLLNWPAIGSVRLDSTWYAYAKAGETVHATAQTVSIYPYGAPDPDKAYQPSSPQTRVQIFDPSGASVASCTAVGTRETCATSVAAKATGAFKVVWDVPNLVLNGAQVYIREDVWVAASGADQVGRVFAPSWTGEQYGALHDLDPSSFASDGAAALVMVYVVGDDGTVFKVEMADYMGISSDFFADSLGVYEAATCRPTNRSASYTGNYTPPAYVTGGVSERGCGREFLLFPDPPSADVPESLTSAQGWAGPLYPRYQVPPTPQIKSVKAASPVDPARPYALSATLDLGSFKGGYEVSVDVNGDGDVSDAADLVKAYQQLSPGKAIAWAWDGRDAQGKAVPGSGPQPKLTVKLTRGNEYHLLLNDVEDLAGGARIQQLAGYEVAKNGGKAIWPRIHWDDTDVAAEYPGGDDWRDAMTTEPKLIATPAEGIQQTGSFVHGWKRFDGAEWASGWGDNARISFNVWNDLSADAGLSATRVLRARHLDLVSKVGQLQPVADGARRIAYELTVKNTGNADFTTGAPAVVTDALPLHMSDWRMDGLQFSGGTSVSGVTTSFTGGRLNWSAPLKAGETAKVRYSGTVEPGFEATRVNTVSTDRCPALADEGSIVTVSSCDDVPVGSTVNLAGLKVEKTVATSGLHQAGHFADYTVTLTNIGRAAYTTADPALVTDDLSGVLDDSTLDVDSLMPTGAHWDPTAQVITWSGPLAEGASQQITYRVVYAPGAAGADLRLDNTASIRPVDVIDQTPGLRAQTSTPGSDLHLSKAADVERVKAGGRVGYTVTLDNSRGKAAAPVAWKDDLSGVLDDAALIEGPAVTGQGVTVKREGAALVLSGQVGAGQKVVVKYAVRVLEDVGDRVLRNALIGQCDGGRCAAPAECRQDDPLTTCTPVVGYRVAKEAVTPEPDRAPRPGETVTYRLIFTNVGSEPIAVDQTDDLSGVLDDAVVGELDLTGAAGLTADLADDQLVIGGSLGVGVTAVITYQALIRPEAERGDSILINHVVPADVSTETPVAELTLRKTAEPAVAHPGEVVSYRLELRSVGAATVGVELIDDFSWASDDAALVAEPVSDSESVVVTREPGLSVFAMTGELAAGETAVISYQMKVLEAVDPENSDDVMTNVVVAPDSWTPPSERPECDAFAPGACTTTPVVRPEPEIALPVTGMEPAWPVGLGLAFASGGLALVFVARRRARGL